MPRPLEILSGPEREDWIAKAKEGRELALYPRTTVLRGHGAVRVVFEPVVLFVGETQLVTSKLTVVLFDGGLAHGRVSGVEREVCQGRGLDKAALGQEPELLRDSTARQVAIGFINGAMLKHGNLGAHGDYSNGLGPLSALNVVVIYDEPHAYAVEAWPILQSAAAHTMDFRVRKRDGVIDEFTLAATSGMPGAVDLSALSLPLTTPPAFAPSPPTALGAPAPTTAVDAKPLGNDDDVGTDRPVPAATPVGPARLGESEEAKTDQVASPAPDTHDTQKGLPQVSSQTLEEE